LVTRPRVRGRNKITLDVVVVAARFIVPNETLNIYRMNIFTLTLTSTSSAKEILREYGCNPEGLGCPTI